MISAVILAAGLSSRMGSNKLLLILGHKTLIEHVVQNALDSKVEEVIVVTGHQAEKVKDFIPKLPRVKIVNNPGHKDGISGSIRTGLAEVSSGSEAVVVLLADQPFVKPWIINALVDKFKRTSVDVVASRHLGEARNPMLFSKVLFPAIARLQGDKGARDLVLAGEWRVAFLDLDHAEYLRDLDTPGDLKWVESVSRKNVSS